MLHLISDFNRTAEKSYLAHVLSDFLGIPFQFRTENIRGFQITDSEGTAKIYLCNNLLAFSDRQWLKPESLPQTPLTDFFPGEMGLNPLLTKKSVPIIYGPSSEHPAGIQADGKSITLPFDLLGSIFFMLSRYEELVVPDRDVHQRFPARASLAFKQGFLTRPIVNEYVEVLWSAMQQLWPGLERKKRSFKVQVSHDVDDPFLYLDKPLAKCIRLYGGEVFRRKSTLYALQRLSEVHQIRTKQLADPFDTFSWIMDQSEKNGLTSHFYFKCGAKTEFDTGYDIFSPEIQQRISEIHHRGHSLGFHPGYFTFNSELEWQKQFDLLSRASPQQIKSGRQHYLRFQAPLTWRLWDSANCEIDSTLGYADHIGFRTGSCYEHPIFDLEERRTLHLRELPLQVMEGSLLNPSYMGLPSMEAAYEAAEAIKSASKTFQGTFTLLWHNTMLRTQEARSTYEQLIR